LRTAGVSVAGAGSIDDPHAAFLVNQDHLLLTGVTADDQLKSDRRGAPAALGRQVRRAFLAFFVSDMAVSLRFR